MAIVKLKQITQLKSKQIEADLMLINLVPILWTL